MQENNVLPQPKLIQCDVPTNSQEEKLAFQTEAVTTGLSLCNAPGDSLRPHCARPQISNRLIISTCETNFPPNYAPHEAHKAVRPTLGQT